MYLASTRVFNKTRVLDKFTWVKSCEPTLSLPLAREWNEHRKHSLTINTGNYHKSGFSWLNDWFWCDVWISYNLDVPMLHLDVLILHQLIPVFVNLELYLSNIVLLCEYVLCICITLQYVITIINLAECSLSNFLLLYQNEK